jgi:ADP-ribose pyrophosphatase YjhB (NUDIX family)
VFAFIIKDNKILVIRNKKENRGLEIPGGHVERNETPEAALKRECLEEASVTIKDIRISILYEILDPQATKYPKRSHQVFYIAHTDEIHHFVENEEIQERLFLDYNEFKKMEWSQEYPDLVDAVLKQIKN